ncbi:GSCFA domain-containing protein [Faunimonas sp. B44]|uniref:GSCFA domain-containing protein n=1 Tax=Faunimonas sp. B44 TaxID=3461493 RepID=UPI004045030E
MAMHPYKAQADKAFWSRAVSTAYDPASLLSPPEPLIRLGDKVMSAGSCFASNLVPYLEKAGLTYLRTEPTHPLVLDLDENLGYRNFTAAYGNIYTARQLRQLLERSLGMFRPSEDRWHWQGKVIDPFRPGLRYPAQTDAEFDLLTAQHLRAVRTAFETADVMVFTLGLTEAWMTTTDGAVYPACPGTVNGAFDPERHVFHNFTLDEVRQDLVDFLKAARKLNPGLRLILTVSPVPLVATATADHVLLASTYSKAVLRAAAGEVASSEEGVTYFPAFEIVTGPQAPSTSFEPDRRNVSKAAVDTVMRVLLAHCETREHPTASAFGQPSPAASAPSRADISERLAQAECEEALADL